VPASQGTEVVIEYNKDMSERIRQYQQFIGKYVVEAQEQKAQAVREAEERVTAHYEEKLAAAIAAAPKAAPAAKVAPAVKVAPAAKAEPAATAKAVAHVEPAAKSAPVLEIEHAATATHPAPATPAASTKAKPAAPAKAKPAAPAAPAETPAADADTLTAEAIYDARNARIVTEAAEGTSRWGDAEVDVAPRPPGSIGKQAPAVAEATPVDGATYPPAFIAGSPQANAFFAGRKEQPVKTALGWSEADPEGVHKSGLHVFDNLNTDGTVVKS